MDRPSSTAHIEGIYAQLQAQEERLRQVMGPVAYMDQVTVQLEAYRRTQGGAERLFDDLEQWRRSYSTVFDALEVTSAATRAFEEALAITARADVPNEIGALFESYNRQINSIATSGNVLRVADEFLSNTAQWAQFQPLLASQELLSASSAKVYAQLTLGSESARVLSPWLSSAPAVEPYSSARALAIVSGADIDLEATRDDISEDQLSRATDDLEVRLAAVGTVFVKPYRGARAAVMSRHEDWHRHTAISLRELMTHLLEHLAPDSALDAYYEDPSDWKENGRYTRRAQLRYIFRHISADSYALMAEHDINLTLATFYPSNYAVHRIESPLTDAQLLVLWRRMQGCISVVLEAAAADR